MTGHEPDNPWRTPDGARAREHLFRRLAGGDGPIADFAKDVLAGDRRPEELFTYSPATEEITTRLAACARLWHRLPAPIRNEAIDQAPDTLQAYVRDLAESPDRPPGPD
ncbi:MAG TPA: hypothetical protein VJX10_02000 [Pseudonocardiaceae bacterium]|nr:hypothetical protein [Pseudonocardiaceae bacterium]